MPPPSGAGAPAGGWSPWKLRGTPALSAAEIAAQNAPAYMRASVGPARWFHAGMGRIPWIGNFLSGITPKTYPGMAFWPLAGHAFRSGEYANRAADYAQARQWQEMRNNKLMALAGIVAPDSMLTTALARYNPDVAAYYQMLSEGEGRPNKFQDVWNVVKPFASGYQGQFYKMQDEWNQAAEQRQRELSGQTAETGNAG